MTRVTEKLAEVRERIAAAARRCGRDPRSVHLVAVSKQHSVASIREALEAGQRDFGENHLQEAVPKIAELGPDTACWHFIGPVQSNKTRSIAAHFEWVHTIDRARIARRLSEQRPHHAPPLQVCLQVKLAAAAARAGVEPEELPALAGLVTDLPRIRLRGLMCLPPPEVDFERQRKPFRRLRQYLEELRQAGYELDTLSMGMTNDLEAAIAEGATIVRVGTAMFGPRPPASAGGLSAGT